MAEYTTTAGTEPDPVLPHDPRTIERSESDGRLYLMSEIGDGVFVQWGNCRACGRVIALCKCADGPKEPEHVTRWRAQRFGRDLASRLPGRPGEPAREAEAEVGYDMGPALDSAIAAVSDTESTPDYEGLSDDDPGF